jgi:hypothetical protein
MPLGDLDCHLLCAANLRHTTADDTAAPRGNLKSRMI